MTIPGSKMYIITKPDLVQSVQRQQKSLAFPPIEAKFASTVCGSSSEAHNILLQNVNGDEGDWGLSMESYSAMRAALKPGPALDDMNRVMIENIASSLDQLGMDGGLVNARIGLSAWLRKAITMATTNAVYGPENPFKEGSVADAFW